MFKSYVASACVIAGFALGSAVRADAEDKSFTGTFENDSSTAAIGFTIGSPSDVVINTLSYAGGVNVDGMKIAPGGFDPILTLFDSTGTFIAFSDLGTADQVGADPLTGVRDDAYLEVSLISGNYVVVISQYDNFLENPPRTGNFTGPLFGCTQGFFCDTMHTNRTGNWAVDIKGVKGVPSDPGGPGPSPVPAPAALWLLGSAVFGLEATRRWRKRRSVV